MIILLKWRATLLQIFILQEGIKGFLLDEISVWHMRSVCREEQLSALNFTGVMVDAKKK